MGRSEVKTAFATFKAVVLCVLARDSLFDGYQHFGGIYCIHLQGRSFDPEDTDSMFLQDVDTRLHGIITHKTRYAHYFVQPNIPF
jgi:hypothetical protein